ncbi:MAG: PepSY-like domain-containing protein [Bacteroidetes bacterium]|nr:PepSY-like domain-containing protein [Bacteroidota bacterium]
MKKICFLLAVISALQLSAQRVTIDNIPDEVSIAFKAKFSIAEKTSWAIDEDNYKADFKVSKAIFTATFDKGGKWLMTEKFIKSSDLPKSVREAVTKEFGQLSGYTYLDVEKVETEKRVVYEMDIKKGEGNYKVVVSEKGEILTKEAKEEIKEG